MTARALLEGLFRTAIAAAHPSVCLPPHLPPAAGIGPADRAGRRQGRRVHGRGGGAGLRRPAAAGSPASPWRGRAMAGRSRSIPMIEAGHPIPDAAGLEAAERSAQACRGRGRGRSGAGAALGRRIGELDRTGARTVARRQAGGDAGAACARAPTSARSTRCESIFRASRAGGLAQACAAEHACSRSRFPTCRATIPR